MLDVQEFFLTGDAQDGGLTLAFKRYRARSGEQVDDGKEGVALILAHSVGSHKEIWQPTIQHLFHLQSLNSHGFVVEEVWATDSPNHGHPAILNEKALLKRPEGISGYNWGRAVQSLLKSGLIASKNVVGIGHSAGITIMTLSTVGFPMDMLPYSSMIIIEPGMMTREIFAKAFKSPTVLSRVMESVRTSRDIWPSRDAARDWFRKRLPWKRWHPDVFDIFIEYGLRDLPTATHPDNREGVTVTCTREQETASYLYPQDAIDSLDRLSELCSRIPIHCILGSRIDLVADETRRGILDAIQGRRMASISVIEGAGHLVVQEDPAGVAVAIRKALDFNYYEKKGKSKL